jgi:hypothetical protein
MANSARQAEQSHFRFARGGGEKRNEAQTKASGREEREPAKLAADRQGLGPSTAAGWSRQTGGKKLQHWAVSMPVSREDRRSRNQGKGKREITPLGSFRAFALPGLAGGRRWREDSGGAGEGNWRIRSHSTAAEYTVAAASFMWHVAWWTRRVEFRVGLSGMYMYRESRDG